MNNKKIARKLNKIAKELLSKNTFDKSGYDSIKRVWKDKNSMNQYFDKVDKRNSERTNRVEQTDSKTVKQTDSKTDDFVYIENPSTDIVNIEESLTKNYSETIDKDVFLDMLNKGHLTIMSAGKNSDEITHQDKPPQYFEEQHEKLKRDIAQFDLPFVECLGKYDNLNEKSYAVYHNDLPQDNDDSNKELVIGRNGEDENVIHELDKLGNKYRQNSVLHTAEGNGSLHFTTGDNINKQYDDEGYEIIEEDDNFTKIKHNNEVTKFAMNIGGAFEDNPNLTSFKNPIEDILKT